MLYMASAKKAVRSIAAFFLVCSASLLQGQSSGEPPTANVTFFNATTNSSPVLIKWSGVEVFPDGLAAGQSAGPLAIPAAGASMDVSIEGCLPAKAAVSPQQDAKTTFIFYLGAAEADKETGEMKPRVKVFQSAATPLSAQAKLEWPVLYVGEAESVQIDVNGSPVTLPRNKNVTVARGEKYVRLSQGDRELAAISVEEAADRAFVVHGPSQNLSAGVVYR
jgi:hypothetical protein